MRVRVTPTTALTLGIVWLAIEYVVAGPYSVLYAGDNSEIIVAGLVRGRHFEHLFPLWDRFAAAGSDRETLSFTGVLDVWLFGVLPGWLAAAMRSATQAAVAVMGAYVLARRTFRFEPWTAVFCGFAYGLLFQHGMFIDAATTYQIGLLAALDYVLERKSSLARWLLLAAMIFVTAETAYFSRLVPFTSALIIAWYLFFDPRRSRSDWLIIVATAAFVAVLRVDNAAALMREAPLSQLGMVRIQATLTDAIWHVARHPFLQSPLHVLCTAFFLYGIAALGLSAPRIKGMLALLVLGMAVPVSAVAVQLWLIRYLPFLQGYDFLRFTFISTCALPFAAGFGFGALTKRATNRNLARAGWAVAALVFVYASLERKWVGASEWLTQGTFTLNYESPVLHDLARRMNDGPLPVRAETVQIYSPYLNAYGIETAGGYQPVYLRRYHTFWGKMVEPGLAPDAIPYRGDKLELIPADHKAERRLGELYRLNMLSLANVGYFVSRDRLTDEGLELLDAPDRPWSELSTREKIVRNSKENFTGRRSLYVYRNAEVLPRIFAVDGLNILGTDEAVLDAVARRPASELRARAIAARSDLPAGYDRDTALAPVAFRLERYTSDALRIAYEARGAGLLVVTNSYSPFWRCESGGGRLDLFPVYHAFWGIPIGGGAGTIDCRYDPPGLWSTLTGRGS